MLLNRPKRSRRGRAYRDDFCLVFLHLPKTGGTTLATSLRWNYPVSQTVRADIFGKPDAIEQTFARDRMAHVRLLYGHVPYGVHRRIPRACRYVTIVREPVARVVSAYKYVLANKAHRLNEMMVQGNVGLEEYVERFWVGQQVSRQTRQLCDRADGPLDQGALEEAQRNLSDFLVVGLTERFAESFVLIRRALALRRPFYITRNVGRTIEVSDYAVELIRRREEFDVALHSFAQEVFERQIAREGRSVAPEAALYRAATPLLKAAAERFPSHR